MGVLRGSVTRNQTSYEGWEVKYKRLKIMAISNSPYEENKNPRQQVKEMKMSEYMRGYSDEDIKCKNCSHVSGNIREDINEPVFCDLEHKYVELTSSCPKFNHKSFANNNPADYL